MNTPTRAFDNAFADASPHAIVWADPARASAFASWLLSLAAEHPLMLDSVRLASADASFRRYFRVDSSLGSSPGSYIIMDAPPDKEDCAPFVKVAGLMAAAGLQVPRVLAWNEQLGFMLLSDLGAQTMMEVISPPVGALAIAQPTALDMQLYGHATDALIRWQLASKPGVLPAYDDALLSRELGLFPEWYVQKYRGFALDEQQKKTLDDAFAHIKASNLQALEGARVYVHRDFMPRNLMKNNAPTLVASRTALDVPAPEALALRAVQTRAGGLGAAALSPEGALPLQGATPPEAAHLQAVQPRAGGLGAIACSLRPGKASSAAPAGEENASTLGILDFQDAVYGPITYDIASLMRDAFLSWEEDFVLDITVRYWQKARKAGLPVGDDFGEFYRAVEWMGLQRHLKILGIFARLSLRDGKPKYLADTPRFVKYVRATAARYRQLGPFMVLLDAIEGNQTRVGYTF
ncbi:MAG: aminoglycoside phosphotransferase [Polaromonas sp.]|nr:MAG: aminoglycoside phosphotransferase [Polaromonas sp.]